jgi:hypothetical protein
MRGEGMLMAAGGGRGARRRGMLATDWHGLGGEGGLPAEPPPPPAPPQGVVLNLRMVDEPARVAGVDLHVCEVQIVLAAFAALQEARPLPRPPRAGAGGVRPAQASGSRGRLGDPCAGPRPPGHRHQSYPPTVTL